jgi:hypothetical protein
MRKSQRSSLPLRQRTRTNNAKEKKIETAEKRYVNVSDLGGKDEIECEN